MKKFFIIFSMHMGICFSQNLILNGDFESFLSCPTNLGQIKYCKDVSNPNIFTSPDFFNYRCSSFEMDYYPYKLFNIEPQSGNAYIGLASRTEQAYSYQEYVLLKLDSCLEKGLVYNLTFYVKLKNLRYFQDVFDIKFTDKEEFSTRSVKGYSIIDEKDVISISKVQGYKDTLNWEKVTYDYTAKGSEKYLLIGLNFQTLKKRCYINSKKYILNRENTVDNICYYFYDNFRLIKQY